MMNENENENENDKHDQDATVSPSLSASSSSDSSSEEERRCSEQQELDKKPSSSFTFATQQDLSFESFGSHDSSEKEKNLAIETKSSSHDDDNNNNSIIIYQTAEEEHAGKKLRRHLRLFRFSKSPTSQQANYSEDDDAAFEPDDRQIVLMPSSPVRFSMRKKKRVYLTIAVAVVGFIFIIAGIAARAKNNKKESSSQVVTTPQDDTLSSTAGSSFDFDDTTASPSSATAGPTISPGPSYQPTAAPIQDPTFSPTSNPTQGPSEQPSNTPTLSPSQNPTSDPSSSPTSTPTTSPTSDPTSSPTESPVDWSSISYRPGNLTIRQAGLILSEGLAAREIASSGSRVTYNDGTRSSTRFHGLPDGGETFLDTRPNNPGGWIYVSNSEMPDVGDGGVGAITFDSDGNILDYKMILEGTTMNCGGGATPWGTWVSCEELDYDGQIYQVDPTGEKPAQIMPMGHVGSKGGRYEAFTFDDRNRTHPKFFASEDHNRGAVRRFTPSPEVVDWDNPWDMLHDEDGTTDFLVLHPERDENGTIYGGTFEWTTDLRRARRNTREYYPQTEGIDRHDGQLYFVCKNIRQMFTINLDLGTYTNSSTVTGLFDGKPDQIQQILEDPTSILYFTEEGGKDAGVHARDSTGGFYTILEGLDYIDETAGLAFSPDAKHMYIAYQENGKLFDIYRQDGMPFNGRRLDVKYHGIGLG